MAGVNKVILLGNLGGDPEVRQVGETKVANFNIATSESYNDKQGNKVEKTEWHRIELWGGLAGIAEQYLRKGNSVYVEGKIATEEYTDKDGISRRSIKIRGTSMTLIGGGNRSEGEAKQPEPPKVNSSAELPSNSNSVDDDHPLLGW
jgi:single-strand DNA-binding protein